MWAVYWSLGLVNLLMHMKHKPTWVFERKLQPRALFKSEGSGTNPPLASFVVYLIVSHLLFVLPSMFVLQLVSRTFLGSGVQLGWPGWPTILWQVVAHSIGSVLFVEVAFYYTHRFLHWGPIYGHVHKMHHRFKAPIALSALYAHPIELVFGNALSTLAPPFLFGTNIYLYFIMIVTGIISTMSDHSGFCLPWASGSIQPDFHDWHHETFQENFGLLGIMDKFHNTSTKWASQWKTRRSALLKTAKQ